MVKIAIEVWSSSFAQVESTGRRAESLELDAFYYGESPHRLNLDCWTTLAALAKSTERIRLGPVITNVLPDYRSTALLAKQASTVAEISGGRLDFRTGVGAAASFARPWWEPFGVDYPDYPERYGELERTLAALPELWAGAPLVPDADAADPNGDGRADARIDAGIAVNHIPITVAARGSRAMALAAAHAATWETSFCTPAEFAEQAAAMATLAGGRPIERSLEIDGFVATDRRRLADLRQRLEADRGRTEDLTPIVAKALTGLPDEVADQLARLAAAGVDQVVVALHDPHDPDALEALAAAAALIGGSSA